ncbi:hypothetical protein [Methanohalophilus mahii]|uniref:DUF5658 domain-containing protein n=1 Tax=Methanohalophilus mahii (strain ATCC 35705 / DSM 5219 / SLP) TaxID=547558 RepID=D5EAS4_METMS|nr:hypothetical protein [Methanohalophilus mahii]ADE36275.1 hypothetical protein Mmah_0751 [Methanohalophilus mahii DSM 5219]
MEFPDSSTVEYSGKDLFVFLSDIKYIILFYVFGDFLTTMGALNFGVEQNGFIAFVLAEFGPGAFLFLKLLFIVIVYLNYKLISQSGLSWSSLLWNSSKFAIAFLGIVLVVNNLMVMLTQTSLIV